MRSLAWMTTAVLAAVLAGCGGSGGKAESEAQTAATGGGAPASAPAPRTPAEVQALLAAYPAPYNTADLENGRKKFGMCRSCHSITPGGPNMTGPNLHGIFGQQAAQNAEFKYSEALKTSNIVWDASHLDQWLANPRTYLPGTKMSFAGLKDAKDRTDLIAYLMVETGFRPQ